MLKTFMSATAISALMVSGALAQAPAQEPATPPAATQPAPDAPAATPAPAEKPAAEAPAAGGAPQFIASQSSDQWLASRFRGSDVLGPDNKKVGDVTDILFDQEGKILAIVVGVGGFLGIGQKDVALDLAAFEVVAPEAASSGGTAEAPAGGTTGTAAPPPPAATGGGTGGSAGLNATGVTDPNNINLRIAMTREQLDEAPAFERYSAPTPTTGTGPGAPAGGGGMAR